MRTLIQAELDTDTANHLITDGTLGKVIENVMSLLKPEAAYFLPMNGHRCAMFVVDLPDEATMVPFAESLFIETKAKITMTPCMNAQDVASGMTKLGTM
jgi:hypothetical protein